MPPNLNKMQGGLGNSLPASPRTVRHDCGKTGTGAVVSPERVPKHLGIPAGLHAARAYASSSFITFRAMKFSAFPR